MRFSPQFLDELRAGFRCRGRRRRVKLRKAGREWKGLSPFNKEKTPSFFVNDQKQAWFDFPPEEGSIFDFLMLTEGLSFPRRSSGSPPTPACTPKVSHEEEAREEKRAALPASWRWRRSSSSRRLAGRSAPRRAAISRRSLDPATQVKFARLCVSRRFALKEHLGNPRASR